MKKSLNTVSLLVASTAVLTTGCAHTRNSCWQRKEDKKLTTDYLNCMREVKIAPRINECFADQTKKEAGFHMRLVTAFDVTPQGAVKNAKVMPLDPTHPELAKCMVSAVQDQKFIPSENGDVHVEYPWVLHGETNTLFQF